MKFPPVKDVANALKYHKRYLNKGVDADVRLQMYDDGEWYVRFGSSDYDQDHRGSWGASSIGSRTNCRDLAIELIDQVKEDWYSKQEVSDEKAS